MSSADDTIKTVPPTGAEGDSLPLGAEGDSLPSGASASFGDHLEVLRQMLWRIIVVTAVVAVAVFCCKDITFRMLLAPNSSDFCTYRWTEQLLQWAGMDFHFSDFHVQLISTELGNQFMTHITFSCYLALIIIAPYILEELFLFVSPALYEHERKYSKRLVVSVYLLFMVGVLLTYFVLFPFSVRFLATYSVSEEVTATITLASYVDTFLTLTLLMGVVFQLPVVAWLLARMGLITASMLTQYRKHAFVALMIVAAIITPPDIMTLLLVTVPLYLLYELSIRVVQLTRRV